MTGGDDGSRGGRIGSPPTKRARHDAEAGSSSRAVEPWRLRQARDRSRLSPSDGQSPWAAFDVLDEHVFPHIQRCREADEELVVAEKAVVAEEEGVADRLATAKEEHDLSQALRKTAAKFYLGVDE